MQQTVNLMLNVYVHVTTIKLEKIEDARPGLNIMNKKKTRSLSKENRTIKLVVFKNV